MPLTPDQLAEIEQQRAKPRPTLRQTVPALEALLYRPVPVLDHGFIRVIDYMGDDAAIVQAARVSYGRGTRKVSEDAGLIRYLMRHRHTTPFEMCAIKFHVKLPIFVARQWIRHRTASVNEYSARYSILDREFYVPDVDYLKTRRAERRIRRAEAHGQPDLFPDVGPLQPRHTAAQAIGNRQGRAEVLPADEAAQVLRWIKEEAARSYTIYTKLLNEDPKGTVLDANRQGVARELARMVLPANIYTQWYWKIDLHNLLHFLELRADAHAQYEIRAYAEAMLETVAVWVPLVHQAFLDYRLGAVNVSAPMLAVLRRMLAGERVEQPESRLSKREFSELKAALEQGVSGEV
ncbi:MAG: FAD-dependent thymidylate synthase [Rhodospirillales bacterium]|nr:FAD-dependent thymidylate synthase [Rhodospirillales bacterium]